MQPNNHRGRRRLYPWVGVLAVLVLVAPAAWAVEFIPGDVNDDKRFNILDFTALRRTLAGLEDGITQMCLAELPATGQITCRDPGGTVLPCGGTGQDGDVQAGAPLAYQDNGDGTVTDLNTGLMWEKLSDDGSIHDLDDLYTWDDAFGVKVAALNGGGGFAGHTDWRLPNIKELVSIVDYEVFSPSVSLAFNTGCQPACTVLTCSCTVSFAPFGHWSSSFAADTPNNAFLLLFSGGFVVRDNKRFTAYRVRAVRGP